MQKYKQVNVVHPEDVGVPRKIMSEPPQENNPSPAFRGSIWPIVIIALVVLALAVCILPWPTHIQLTLYGAEMNADGSIIQTGEIVIDAWLYNYLFRRDEFHVKELQLPDHDTGINIQEIDTFFQHFESADFYQARFAWWRPAENSEWINQGVIHFSDDQHNWAVKLNNRIFIGSTQEHADYIKIMSDLVLGID